jgi:hypothetical protein
MNRFAGTIICALVAIVSICAQDIIITNDAQKIEAKILEVSKTEIKYKEMDNLEGPTFVLETQEISTVIYANGKVVLYNQQQQPQQLQQQPQQAEQKQAEQKHETPQVSTYVPTADESMAEVLLLSGQTLIVQITDMKSDHIAYIQNGNSYTLPASQIDKVTFLKGGQVREYKDKIAVQNTIVTQKEGDSSTKSGRIYRDNGQYLYNDTYISSVEVARILKRENAEAYEKWKKAEGMLIGGSVCAGIGGGLVIGGLISIIADPMICLGMECAALVPLGIGLGLTFGSTAQYNSAINIYNAKYDQAAVQLKWHVAINEVGLAIAF